MYYKNYLAKRNIVMAFAIVWIMLYHMHQTTGVAWLDAFVGIGYVGSDIFYFVSGIGIWLSLEKSEGLTQYYKKRFFRVMPMYWCFIGFWIAFRMIWFELTFAQAVANVFAVESFFDIDRAFNWYISFLLVFYIASPFIKKFMEVLPGVLGTILICGMAFVAGYFWVDDPDIMIGLARLPVFVLGMYFGSRMCGDTYERETCYTSSDGTDGSKDNGKGVGTLNGRFSPAEIVAWLILIPVGLFLVMYFGRDFLASWHNGMLWYPAFVAVPGMYFLIALIFDVLPEVCCRPFCFLGRHTLSLYLIHIFFFEIYERYFLGLKGVAPHRWHWIVIYAAVGIGCFLLEGCISAKRDSRGKRIEKKKYLS